MQHRYGYWCLHICIVLNLLDTFSFMIDLFDCYVLQFRETFDRLCNSLIGLKCITLNVIHFPFSRHFLWTVFVCILFYSFWLQTLFYDCVHCFCVFFEKNGSNKCPNETPFMQSFFPGLFLCLYKEPQTRKPQMGSHHRPKSPQNWKPQPQKPNSRPQPNNPKPQ